MAERLTNLHRLTEGTGGLEDLKEKAEDGPMDRFLYS